MLEQIITFVQELREQLLAIAPNAVHDKLAALPMPGPYRKALNQLLHPHG
jgi:hypothetical protein